MNIGSSVLDIGYSIALPQVETCLSQKPLFTQAGDNLEIRVTAQEDRVQGSGFRRIAGLFGA